MGKLTRSLVRTVNPNCYSSSFYDKHQTDGMATVVLVTGGTGLVGKAIEHIIETEPAESRFGKKQNEIWIFASSSEGDLRRDMESLFI